MRIYKLWIIKWQREWEMVNRLVYKLKKRTLRCCFISLAIYSSWCVCYFKLNGLFLCSFALCKYSLLTLHNPSRCNFQVNKRANSFTLTIFTSNNCKGPLYCNCCKIQMIKPNKILIILTASFYANPKDRR